MGKLKAVIFDMDGTLVDSREVVLGAFKHVLAEMGQPYNEAVVSSHVGRILDHTYKSLIPNGDIAKLKELHWGWQFENKHLFKSFKGLEDFLSQLKSKGLKLAIFTSAVRARTDLALDGLGIRDYFDVIVCGDEVKNPKPHKEGVVTIIKSLELSPSNIVMVGDAEHDISSGKNAGVVSIGVTHGFGTKEALEKAGADYIVSNLTELQTVLDRL